MLQLYSVTIPKSVDLLILTHLRHRRTNELIVVMIVLQVEFAAVDCTTHISLCSTYDVKGYPSIKYFNYFKNSKPYEGGRSEADFVAFMKDPQNPLSTAPPIPPSPEEQWSAVEGAEHIRHLTDATFNDFISQQESILVMFYAPCKILSSSAFYIEHILNFSSGIV